jgi:nicotinamide mononucleotide (NMN) deamidase PncC
LRVDRDIWQQVESLLQGGGQLALAATGGGGELVSWLLNHPGASGSVIEVQVPYREEALAAYLGSAGPHRVTAQTARDMADRAFVRARRFTGVEEGMVGVGVTAALTTSRSRRGEDRAYIALRLPQEYRLFDLHFEKGAADRLAQEEGLSRFVLAVLAEACGAEAISPPLPDYVKCSRHTLSLQDPLGLLVTGDIELVEFGLDGVWASEVERGSRLLFPGSFNPLHEGHERLAVAAGRLSGRRPSLELSVENVDKPSLQRVDIEGRLAAMRGRFSVIMTRAPTFLQKARLFSGCHFAIGYDTATRLLQGKYYEGGEQGMVTALEEFRAGEHCFWVAGRLQAGKYLALADIDVPAGFAALFAAIPEEDFRVDISSTELRSRANKGAR